ncbi:MAG: hypothetical protein HQ514_10540, partial [Rhodospirillales bacterium]|nr:hypothetical protein [Rhodospirillales bacterium]
MRKERRRGDKAGTGMLCLPERRLHAPERIYVNAHPLERLRVPMPQWGLKHYVETVTVALVVLAPEAESHPLIKIVTILDFIEKDETHELAARRRRVAEKIINESPGIGRHIHRRFFQNVSG